MANINEKILKEKQTKMNETSFTREEVSKLLGKKVTLNTAIGREEIVMGLHGTIKSGNIPDEIQSPEYTINVEYKTNNGTKKWESRFITKAIFTKHFFLK